MNPVSKDKKRNELSLFDNLTQYREVEKGTIMDILKQKDTQIKSLNARIIKLEPFDDNDAEEKSVSWEEIQALVNQAYPQYGKFLPLMKKQIMDLTKGMSLDEILTYVKTITGNKQSQGNTDPQSTEYNPNWA